MKAKLKKYYSDGCGGLVSGVKGITNAITSFEIPVKNINMENLIKKYGEYGGSHCLWVLSEYIHKHGEIGKIIVRVRFDKHGVNNIPDGLEFDGVVSFLDDETFGSLGAGFMEFGRVKQFKRENCINLKDLSKMVNETIGYLFDTNIELTEQE